MTKLLFFLVLSLSSFAFAEGDSHVGFYPVSHLGIPQAVRVASKSVFQVLVPNFEGHSLNTFKIPSASYSKLKKNFFNYKNMDPLSRKAIAAQIQFCDQQIGRTCDIFLNTQRATGFFMNGTFWTNAHVVEPYFDGLTNPAKQNLLIFIFNQKENLVLNPLVDSVELDRLPLLTEKARQRGSFYSEESDFVSLKIQKNLAPSLEAAILTTDPMKFFLQDLYIPGFASCTHCHVENSLEKYDALDRSPLPNSTGKGLSITHGPLFDSIAASEALEIPLEKLLSLSGEGLLFVNSDSRHGMSGAPILNPQGEVVGIYAGGKINLQNGHLHRVSRGVKVQQLLN